jgi:hypothetical protein
MSPQEILPLEGDEKHHRHIHFSSSRLDSETVQIRGELIDKRADGGLIHHILVRLNLDPKMTITRAEFKSVKAPYLECQTFKVGPERLLGLNVQKGFTQKALVIYGMVLMVTSPRYPTVYIALCLYFHHRG